MIEFSTYFPIKTIEMSKTIFKNLGFKTSLQYAMHMTGMMLKEFPNMNIEKMMKLIHGKELKITLIPLSDDKNE